MNRLGDPRAHLTEQWLADIGFKWHQMDRQPSKHWVLWLGHAIEDRNVSLCDIGIELAANRYTGRRGDPVDRENWFCWIRSDAGHRYHRFLHVRNIRTRGELLGLIWGLTGVEFDPANSWYGHLVTPQQAERNRIEHDRMDLRMARDAYPHNELESDATAGGPLIEHKVAFIEQRKPA